MFFHKCTFIDRNKKTDYMDMYSYFENPCRYCPEETRECFMLSKLLIDNNKIGLEPVFVFPNTAEGLLIADTVTSILNKRSYECHNRTNLGYKISFIDSNGDWDLIPYAPVDRYNPIAEGKDDKRFYIYINTKSVHENNPTTSVMYMELNYTLEEIIDNLEKFKGERKGTCYNNEGSDVYNSIVSLQNVIKDYMVKGKYYVRYNVQHLYIGNQHSFNGGYKMGWIHSDRKALEINDPEKSEFVRWYNCMLVHRAYVFSHDIDDIFVIRGIDHYKLYDEEMEYELSASGLNKVVVDYAKMAQKTRDVEHKVKYCLMRGKVYERGKVYRKIDGYDMWVSIVEVTDKSIIDMVYSKVKAVLGEDCSEVKKINNREMRLC